MNFFKNSKKYVKDILNIPTYVIINPLICKMDPTWVAMSRAAAFSNKIKFYASINHKRETKKIKL